MRRVQETADFRRSQMGARSCSGDPGDPGGVGGRAHSVSQLEVHVSTVSLIFGVLWLLGSVSSYTFGGLIHVFLALAVGIMLPVVIQGRKVPNR